MARGAVTCFVVVGVYDTQVHNQVIASSPPFFVEIAQEVTKKNTQSSTSPPPHHPKLTLITHCHFGNDHGAPAIHRQHHMIPHYQAIASTPILAKLFENLQRHNQSSARFPPHLPKFTLIEHHHFGSNRGAAASANNAQTVFHYQDIASTPILEEIA